MFCLPFRRRETAPFVALLILSGCDSTTPEACVDIQATLATQQVANDPDDPAIWVHPNDPAKSLIIGTNKAAAPTGAVVVFNLDGTIRQTIDGTDRPNNVDVEYGLTLQGRTADIAVATERLKSRLRIFLIPADESPLTDISSPEGANILQDATGEAAEPMGIALYRRPSDGAIFAIVAPKNGPQQGYLRQYRLEDDGMGKVKATDVRRVGNFLGGKEIEAVAVDDELGYVYYADEGSGIHKWHADPDHPDAARELAHFGRTGFAGDHEGIAIYSMPGGKGYILCTDQIKGNSRYHVYRREGGPAGPHDHSEMVKCIHGGADSTDGLEATSRPLGDRFPAGLVVAMNSGPKNFLLFKWEDFRDSGTPKLK